MPYALHGTERLESGYKGQTQQRYGWKGGFVSYIFVLVWIEGFLTWSHGHLDIHCIAVPISYLPAASNVFCLLLAILYNDNPLYDQHCS